MDFAEKSVNRILAALVLVSVFLVALPAPSVFAQSPSAPIATLKVSKTISSVSLDDIVTFRLGVENNGTVPVFDIEVYEYVNNVLNPASDIIITAPTGESTAPLTIGGVGSATQVIVDPTPPASLMPGQKLSLQYKMHAPHSGDFQVPADLVWFSYLNDKSTIRSNYYSNGFILHIANGYEKAVILVFPYVISALTFVTTISILVWARRRLQMIKK